MTVRLVIGSRNSCPWSLATWMAMRMFELRFEEVLVPLGRPESEGLLGRFSPSGKVPVLVDEAITVWESLAILEHLAERVPAMWPQDPADRALARSVAAEVHGGLGSLHRFLPMDLMARFAPPGRLMRGVAADLKRVRRIWSELREAPAAKDGPFLFGRFGLVDAMFVPIATRFVTYALPAQNPACEAYLQALTSLPALQEWSAEAASEVAAFARVPAPPFHRTAPEPLQLPAHAAGPPLAGTPVRPAPAMVEAGRIASAPAGPAPTPGPVPALAAEEAEAPRPPAPRPQDPVRPRLDHADRPMIHYLDEPAGGGGASAPPTAPARPAIARPSPERPPAPARPPAAEAAAGIGYLDPDAARQPARSPPPAESGRPKQPGRPAGGVPGQPSAGPAAHGGEAAGEGPPRLRRPGTAGAAPVRPGNRFVRALSGGRDHPVSVAEPEHGPEGGPAERPADDPRLAERPSGGAPDLGRPIRGQDPEHPRTIRSSAIKPIGFSGHRRR
ncbi:glutathione S-transferase family protein [Geminicoccus roseus]|uniref:glutathione S-transferase family protein n=1 Tax=Geminicoccus roseus TaxID=404900 RepID=UPI0003F92FF1|nr:glutathione S-transferase family protein [Geminicoccus roseus]